MSSVPPGSALPASVPPAGGANSVNRTRHINQLCDEFEIAWRRSPRPVIEDFLTRAAPDEQDELLRELIGLEAEFRRRTGERPVLDEYRQRFPNRERIIDAVDQQAFATIGSGAVVPSDSTSVGRGYVLPGVSDDERIIGRTIAERYEVHRLIGDGGMGSVYQAKQHPLDRWVALKLIRHDLARDPLAAKRFHREMRAAVRVQHPNTIRVYDYGTAESGELFLVMEYLDGQTLAAVLENRQPLDPARIDHIGMQVVKALAAAHSEGIIHRDLKPQNIILLDHYGDHDLVKVLDFGLARFTEQMPGDENQSLTADGSMVGTPHYMSPEQISGEPVDHRSDLYALGVLLFRMATGQEPFPAKTPFMVIAKHLNELPPKPSSITPGTIPEWLERLILQLLEKDPARRPQSAEELIALFDRSQLKVPAPPREAARLAALRQLRILDTDPEQVFDDLTSLASYICGTPLAAISLVDADRQWFKSTVGMVSRETSRNISFCTHTILGNELFLVPDATQDPRFAESALVQNNPHLKFYAGMPLATADGHNIGALCVMDRQPRELSAEQISALSALSRLVQSQLELRRDLLLLREAVSAEVGGKSSG